MTSFDKGIGKLAGPLLPESPAPGWNLLSEEVSLPAAVLYEDRLTNNLRWMQAFIDEYGLLLAPHGKTTMAPKLFRRQVEGGAWGITVATAQQASVVFGHGIGRVLMANILVGRRNMEMIADLLAEDISRSFFCLVDSPDSVEQLGRFFRARGQTIDVLLELGPEGGRTGARDSGQEAAVLRAIEPWGDAVRLVGVEIYEGVLRDEPAIRSFLRRAVATFETLVREAKVQRARPVLSGAGSAWYDVVAEEFSRIPENATVDIVLRPGCYLTHDVGLYRATQARIEATSSVAQRMRGGLRPALELWAYVLSLPEPGKAIVGLGKRDAAFDAGYPEPALRYRPGSPQKPSPVPAHWKVTGLMDQHAYLQIGQDDDIRVGDMVTFDISHPCLTFDKWRQIAVVDGDYRVIDVVETYF